MTTSESDKSLEPQVSPNDLRAVWTKLEEFQADRKSDEATSIDIRSLRTVCSPDADVEAAWRRTMMVQILNHVMPGWMDGASRDKVFEVASRFPMKHMEPGVQHDEPPFDVREFMKQIAAR